MEISCRSALGRASHLRKCLVDRQASSSSTPCQNWDWNWNTLITQTSSSSSPSSLAVRPRFFNNRGFSAIAYTHSSNHTCSYHYNSTNISNNEYNNNDVIEIKCIRYHPFTTSYPHTLPLSPIFSSGSRTSNNDDDWNLSHCKQLLFLLNSHQQRSFSNSAINYNRSRTNSNSNNSDYGGKGDKGGHYQRKGSQGQSQGQPLINEHLIRMLLQTSTHTADSLQVRLIVDRLNVNSSKNHLDESDKDDVSSSNNDDIDNDNSDNNDNGSSGKKNERNDVQLVSLSEAISITTDNGVDLVGISLQQSIPVLRAIDYSKFLYEQSSKANKRKKNIQRQTKSSKEFTFRSGIDPHDLDRKTKNMISYLQKGHSCQVVITSNRRNLMNDQDVIMTTLNRIQEYVGEYGSAGKLKTNPYGNRGSIMFQPRSKK